jgi:hypothetical protein
MCNNSEVRSCSDYELNERGCYTDHGGVVISLGWNTELFQYICDNIPEAHVLVVDVSAIIAAPPRCRRNRNAFFPDDSVVSQVRGSTRFDEAVGRCECVLRRHGIVLVTCKGGNHRAPTVADSMKRGSRFIVHATLRTRYPLRSDHIAILVHACVKNRSADSFYRLLTQELEGKRCDIHWCAGWQAGDLDTGEWDTSKQFPKAGADVEVLSVRDSWCTVEEKDTGCTYTLPITWLVPKCVFERRECW